MKEAQKRVDEWISQFGYWEPLANLARLTEEVGELARAINLEHGPKPPKEGESANIAEEMGDVLFMIITLANQLDVDLSEVLEQTVSKFEVRDADRHAPKDKG